MDIIKKAMIKTIIYTVTSISVVLSSGPCLSESGDKPRAQPSREENSGETYPGKVEFDEYGNKVKRWSTKGPVKVTDLNRQHPNNLPAGTFINVTPNRVNQADLPEDSREQ